MEFSVKQYLNGLMSELVNKTKIPVELTGEWTKHFPSSAGVYVLFEEQDLVYAGESSSIRRRTTNYSNTKNHTVRRKIGLFNFSHIEGFERASSKKQFPSHIETLVDDWLKNKARVCFLAVELGRKELEELVIKKYKPKYNSNRLWSV